eukprot:13629876-Ditylum_brightwellii.AAC.1
MKSAQCNEEQVLQEWKQKQQDAEETTTTIPHFKVVIQNKSWGPPAKRREVQWPVTECAAQDGGYIKTLSSKAYEQRLINIRKFIPQ